MKNLIFLIMLLMSTNLLAGTYAGIYGVSTNTVSNTAGEYLKGNAALAFGKSTNGKYGVGGEAFFNNSGLGFNAEVYYKVFDKYKISFGKSLIPDVANRTPVENWPSDESDKYGYGNYIGFSFPLKDNVSISMRYVLYDVTHTFISTKCTANCGTNTAVNTTKVSNGFAERNQLWIGVNFSL